MEAARGLVELIVSARTKAHLTLTHLKSSCRQGNARPAAV